MKKFTVLLLMAFCLMMTACGKDSDDTYTMTTEQVKLAEEVTDYITENLPAEYKASSVTKVSAAFTDKSDTCHVSLTLDFSDVELPKEDLAELIVLETTYLVESVYTEAPTALDFHVEYLVNGEVFGSVDNTSGSASYFRTIGTDGEAEEITFD